MARADLRCDLQLPVDIFLDSRQETFRSATTANIGIGGAFISAITSVPENSIVKLRAQIPNCGVLEADGKVLRRQAEGFALKFLNLDTRRMEDLWGLIIGNLTEQSACPYCGSDIALDGGSCVVCGRSLDFSFCLLSGVKNGAGVSSELESLDRMTDVFCDALRDLEARSKNGRESMEALFDELKTAIHKIFDVCRDVERATYGDMELLRAKQKEFRERTHEFFQKSNLMNHARTWPQGHPGDYKVIEKVYRNMPLSEGIGYLLDLYFLSSTLAVAVRERVAMTREILAGELETRAKPHILNIGCGSAREIFELASHIERAGADITCIDFDSDALNFAQGRLSYTAVQSKVSMRKYNALRMVSPERNIKEFGMKDVIYSIGLFDYLTDDVLIKLIGALYALLNPGGKLVAVFKDANLYETMDYHWLVDWSAFYQRTEHESRAILEKAGIPEGSVTTERTSSGVIIFYTAVKAK